MNVLSDRVLVTGATGYIGGRLVPRLLAGGHRIACLTRDPARLADRSWPGVEVVQGDVLEGTALGAALGGVHTAYYLVHSMNAGEAAFAERDRLAARNFAAAARDAGVRHIVYLGGLGDGGLSPHLASRQETGRILRAAGVPVTEFRAAVIVGAGSSSFELLRYLVERLPVMVCPRWVRTRCQPIGVDDVLRYLTDCLAVPASHGRIIEIGGADVLTYRDMMLEYAEVRGLRRRLIHVPLMTPRLSSYWCDLVTPIPASIARPLIEGLRTEVVVRHDTARGLFGFAPMRYREAVRRTLDRGPAGLETVWSDSLASVEHRTARPVRLTSFEGMICERRQRRIRAPVESVFGVLSAVGGHRGWFFANWLWRLRAVVDRLVGGVGLRRGRRDPERLRLGDAVDFWRVEDVVPPGRLLLRAEMKLPGRAWLEWVVAPMGTGSLLTQTAVFEPRGLGGELYWYALYPVHRFIFRGMLRAIAAQAEARVPQAPAHPAGRPAA